VTDPDVQYLRDLAKGYANSFVDGWQEEYRRLQAIADRLESLIPRREHVTSGDCWCEPELDYVDPVTGAKVYVHRDLQ
jgi:hypothetical protein